MNCVLLLSTLLFITASVSTLEPCPGDTRGDKRCNFDGTHRVCAKIGGPNTSFWRFTGQQSWCQTKGSYGGPNGRDMRCPLDKPTWCICKWATARWIKGQTCDETIQFNCEATDVCNLKRSFTDFGTELKAAHDCMAIKCPTQWEACGDMKPVCEDMYGSCVRWARQGFCQHTYTQWMAQNCMKSCKKCPIGSV